MSSRWLWGIVLLGAALRIVPIWFGLPYLRARPDEETAVGQALTMLGGDLNPHFFHWPSLTFYAFAALFAIASGVRRALGFDAPFAYQDYLLLARGLVAFAGTLTIVVLFRLARRVSDTTSALLAAFFLSIAILHVRDSHFAMTDVLTTLLVTASLALLIGGLDTGTAEREGSWRTLLWFAGAGLTGGLAASTKYSAAAIVAAMGAAQIVWLLRSPGRALAPRAWLPSVAFLLAFGLGFIAATPYSVLDYETFERDLKFTMTHLSGGHGVNLGRGWSYHLRVSLPYGVGVPTFIAAAIGLVPLFRQHPRQAAVIGAFAGAFYLSIGSGQTVFFRYVLPIVPVVCLVAAIGVRHAAMWLATRGRLSERAALALLVVLIGLPSLVNSVWFDVVLARTDTRVLAARWLEGTLDEEASLHDAGGIYAQLDLQHLRFHPWYFDPATNSFGDPNARTPDWLVFHESPLRAYAGVEPRLRQLAREKYALVQRFQATRGAAGTAVYDHQDAFFVPLWGLHTVVRPGPTILIYRRLEP